MIADTGLGVSGPNCMGNVCAKTPLRHAHRRPPADGASEGPVALVGQSGGMMIFTNPALEERGIIAEYLITSGNEAGLSVGDYIAFFADQPELKVIVIYVEAISDLDKFKAACRMARAAGKHIVALKLGQSEGGREAALAHTGSLAGSIEAFDAVAGEVGVIRADTLDDVVEIDRAACPYRRAGRTAISAPSRCRARSAACCSTAPRSNGLQFQPLEAATTDKLNAILTVGSLVSNPIDGGFGVLTSADNYMTFDRGHAGRPERRHRAGAGGAAARARLRPRRELHPAGRGLRRHPGEEADRVLHADLARPDRLQPRAARQGAACVVPAGGQQGAARDRQRGAARRAGAAGARTAADDRRPRRRSAQHCRAAAPRAPAPRPLR